MQAKLILTDRWTVFFIWLDEFSVFKIFTLLVKALTLITTKRNCWVQMAKSLIYFFSVQHNPWDLNVFFIHVKSLSAFKTKKDVWPPPCHQKACSNKGVSVLHISILIAIKKLSGDVIFTGLKHFYFLFSFYLLLKNGFLEITISIFVEILNTKQICELI